MMKNNDIEYQLRKILLGFSTALSEKVTSYLESAPNKDDANKELVEETRIFPENIFAGYLYSKETFPSGNIPLFAVKCRNYLEFANFAGSDACKASFTRQQISHYFAECLVYIRKEIKKADAAEKSYLESFIKYISSRGSPDQFFPANAIIQTQFPLPQEITITNSDKTMPISELTESLGDVSAQTDF